jgi:hypothetical protein
VRTHVHKEPTPLARFVGRLCHQKCYSLIMAIERVPGANLTRKRSVTLAGGLIAEVEELAGPRGFSAAAAEALTHWVARTRLRRAIEAYESEAGDITQAEMDAVVADVGGL